MFSGGENDMIDFDPPALNLNWQQPFLEVNRIKQSAEKAYDDLETALFASHYFLIT